MKKLIAKLVFTLAGWKFKLSIDLTKVKRSVMIAAPHTSNWDLIFALGGFWLMGVDVKYFIKQKYTQGPFGFFFKYTGAIGVNQSQNTNLTEYAIKLFEERKNLVLLVPAEGTRKRVEKWRTGFYRIATQAKVPVTLGYLDYKLKIAGVKEIIYPTENFENDMAQIEAVYKNIQGKFPERYNQKIY